MDTENTAEGRMESWQQDYDCDYGWVVAERKEDGRVTLPGG